MNNSIGLKGALFITEICLAVEAVCAIFALKEANKQHERAIMAEKKILTMDTALTIYEIANESLSRQLDEYEQEKD